MLFTYLIKYRQIWYLLCHSIIYTLRLLKTGTFSRTKQKDELVQKGKKKREGCRRMGERERKKKEKERKKRRIKKVCMDDFLIIKFAFEQHFFL